MNERKPCNARCGACEHVWALAFLPMPLEKAANVIRRATCPACGEAKKIYMAASEQPTAAVQT
jgi:hypothetical protein